MTQQVNVPEPRPEVAKPAGGLGVPVSRSRRRWVSGIASGTGVLLAVQAKTALGTTVCQSPSAAISGNTSPRPGGTPSNCSGGRSPGFWKQPQHFGYWVAVTPATFKVPVQSCAPGMQGLTAGDIKTHGTLVSSILPGATVPAGTGVWAVLAFPTSFTNGQLMRHLLSAWLNAGYFPGYPLTKAQIVAMWNAVQGGGTYCPTNMSCGLKGWGADQIITYIEGLYDFNAELETNLCKK